MYDVVLDSPLDYKQIPMYKKRMSWSRKGLENIAKVLTMYASESCTDIYFLARKIRRISTIKENTSE